MWPYCRPELARLNAFDMGIVLKIETRTAFEHLPAILLQARRHGNVGLMIARGDLAVQCRWERLAEVQEDFIDEWLADITHLHAWPHRPPARPHRQRSRANRPLCESSGACRPGARETTTFFTLRPSTSHPRRRD